MGYTDIAMLLDRSGSMQEIADDVAAGFAAFIDEQRSEPGRCLVSLYQFDDTWEPAYEGLPLDRVPPLALYPRGRTALVDALGETIERTRQRLAELGPQARPDVVLVCVMTDGLDNSSHRLTRPRLKALIEHQEAAHGWVFYYLGADQDAIEVGTTLGVTAGRSLSYHRSKVAPALKALSASARRHRRRPPATSDGQPSEAAGFTEDERRSVQA